MRADLGLVSGSEMLSMVLIMDADHILHHREGSLISQCLIRPLVYEARISDQLPWRWVVHVAMYRLLVDRLWLWRDHLSSKEPLRRDGLLDMGHVLL